MLPLGNSLLWQIISPNQVVSYVFGTMHIRDQGMISNADLIKSCIGSVEKYYSELQMDVDPGNIIRFQQMTGGMDISQLMSNHHYLRLRKSIFRSFGIDIHRFRTLYPMLLSNMIQMSILDNEMNEVMDYYLYGEAKKMGKELHYLESQEKQIDIFHKIPMEYQIKSLKHLGRQPGKAKKQLRRLVADYKNGNTRQLYQKSKAQLGKLRGIMLFQRNQEMARTMENELNQESGFVAVGAAHLFGNQGVLRLMKNYGYKIQPL